jgi:PAS domain S-box-containing protein
MNTLRIHALLVEDHEDDVLLVLRELKKGGFDVVSEVVQSKEALRLALERKTWDIVLCDYSLPGFNAFDALRIFKETKLDIPFIIVSGSIGEYTAVDLMKAGVNDYIMKDNMARLGSAVARELKEAKIRQDKANTEKSLENSEKRYRTLFETANDAIMIYHVNADGRSGKFVAVNNIASKLTGYSKDELSGMSIDELVIKGRTGVGSFLMVSKSGTPMVSYKETLRTKDGKTIIVEVSSSYMEYGDQNLKMAIIRDLTERIKNEEQQRELLMSNARSEIQLFVISALPVLASAIPKEIKNLIIRQVGERFETNMRPLFEQEFADQGNDEQDKDLKFKTYLKWFPEWLSNLGIKGEVSKTDGANYLEFHSCPWIKEAEENPIFCLICRVMVVRSHNWIGPMKSAEQESSMAEGATGCRFRLD